MSQQAYDRQTQGGSSQQSFNTSQGSESLENGGSSQMEQLHIDTMQRSFGSQRSPSSISDQISPSMMSGSYTLKSQASGGRITPGFPGQMSPAAMYTGHSRKGSFSSMDGSTEIVQHTPRFVRDTSRLWYKPHISRDEAILLLKDKIAGTFVVRDSNSFPGAFGLAVKVNQIPPNVQTKGQVDSEAELVRHFLIEPTTKGVKLKGCSNEPVFGSLAALVYQHSITPLALPCKILLPEPSTDGLDIVDATLGHSPANNSQLLAQGAACNVLYLNTVDMESLTGPEAVARAVKLSLTQQPAPKTTVVHFKVSSQGITLTDNKRRLFFRRHYALAHVTFCGIDPEDRKWTRQIDNAALQLNAKIFGFVARKTGGTNDNQCHLFAEHDPNQPGSAIVDFVTKVMIGQGRMVKS